jgi:hypothetical protein
MRGSKGAPRASARGVTAPFRCDWVGGRDQNKSHRQRRRQATPTLQRTAPPTRHAPLPPGSPTPVTAQPCPSLPLDQRNHPAPPTPPARLPQGAQHPPRAQRATFPHSQSPDKHPRPARLLRRPTPAPSPIILARRRTLRPPSNVTSCEGRRGPRAPALRNNTTPSLPSEVIPCGGRRGRSPLQMRLGGRAGSKQVSSPTPKASHTHPPTSRTTNPTRPAPEGSPTRVTAQPCPSLPLDQRELPAPHRCGFTRTACTRAQHAPRAQRATFTPPRPARSPHTPPMWIHAYCLHPSPNNAASNARVISVPRASAREAPPPHAPASSQRPPGSPHSSPAESDARRPPPASPSPCQSPSAHRSSD